MATLGAFLDASKAVLTLGVSTNASCRQEIRDVVGKLSDELDRALSIADSYLVGVQFSKDDQELEAYLTSVDSKLMNSFLEHHICAGLYHLADEFKQVFNPKKFTVSLDSFTQIPALIQLLKDGERAVLDDLDEMRIGLRDLALALKGATGQTKKDEKQRVAQAVDYYRHQIATHRKQIKSQRRKVIDNL